MTTLETYGWSDARASYWREHFASTNLSPGRIVSDHGSMFTVATPNHIQAQLAGSAVHKLTATEMPKIGDWVALEIVDGQPAIITDVLPRSTEIIRGHAGRMLDKQVIAANVDTAFVLQPLDHDFSPARLQRYVFQLARQSIEVVIVLNKKDKAKNIQDKQAQLEQLDVDVITISALNDQDLSALNAYIHGGKTIVILGSSGAGKSTLTNRLLGTEKQATQAVREQDSKGRHTTVHRELFVLPSGGMIIDTPGIRELQLWGDSEDLAAAFPDIDSAIARCHYPNCQHDSEERCAIKAGLRDGTVDANRYETYQNFKHELSLLDARRGYISVRRTEQSKEATKRRERRSQRDNYDHDENDES